MDEQKRFDHLVGANIRRLREERGMTQAALAEALNDAGLSNFQQQTIGKVEAGGRPLRFREADQFALALDVPLDTLADEDDVRFDRVAMVLRHVTAVTNAWNELMRVARHFYEVRDWLEGSVSLYRRDPDAFRNMSESLLDQAEALLAVDPARVGAGIAAVRHAELEAENAKIDEISVASRPFRTEFGTEDQEVRDLLTPADEHAEVRAPEAR